MKTLILKKASSAVTISIIGALPESPPCQRGLPSENGGKLR
jgi:hypothetical protein